MQLSVQVDQRKSPRRRALLGGEIVLNNGRSTIDCLVRDLSDGGLRIKLHAPHPIPKEFEIKFGTRREQVELVWQRGVDAGVKFKS